MGGSETNMSDEMKMEIEPYKSLDKTFKHRLFIGIQNLETKEMEFAYFINNRTALAVLKDENSEAVIYEIEEFFKIYKILGAYIELETEIKSKS